jgi:hypothetical protein
MGMAAERASVMIVRLWRPARSERWLARIVEVDPVSGRERVATASSVDEVCNRVRTWIHDFSTEVDV